MNLSQFKESLNKSTPNGLTKLLEALWYDGSGDWEKAHEITQEIHTLQKYMPICIEKKGINGMLTIGMKEPINHFVMQHWIGSGRHL